MSRRMQIACDKCGELIENYILCIKGTKMNYCGIPKRSKKIDICDDCKRKKEAKK